MLMKKERTTTSQYPISIDDIEIYGSPNTAGSSTVVTFLAYFIRNIITTGFISTVQQHPVNVLAH